MIARTSSDFSRNKISKTELAGHTRLRWCHTPAEIAARPATAFQSFSPGDAEAASQAATKAEAEARLSLARLFRGLAFCCTGIQDILRLPYYALHGGARYRISRIVYHNDTAFHDDYFMIAMRHWRFPSRYTRWDYRQSRSRYWMRGQSASRPRVASSRSMLP